MARNLWGGRFKGAADPDFSDFNRSFEFDRRLFVADVRASLAHAKGLVGAGVLTNEEGEAIANGLQTILDCGQADPNYFAEVTAEDVHSFVEGQLVELIGETGRKLHTGRSRNDQVATDLRIWMRESIDQLTDLLRRVQSGLLDFAESNNDVVLPGYTHLRRAQPLLLAHWCLAYLEMFARDRERFADTLKRVNIMPLGAAALAGTSFPIDRAAVARELGFAGISRNSLDAVSDRDFCVEYLSTCSLIMVHLSRLAEDLILYSTSEFGFFELGDAISTGSSLMPQKKNPDSMELVRGKAGRVFGHLQAILTTLKGLALAYNKDMQEDKEGVFDSFDTVSSCLRVTATVLRNIRVNAERAKKAASNGYLNATELADYLVRKGIPFREAHETVGRIVLRAIDLGVELQELPLPELQKFSSLIDASVFEALSLEQTLATKSQAGGTGPRQVAAAIEIARVLVD
jgi:argininosuccinate lyase